MRHMCKEEREYHRLVAEREKRKCRVKRISRESQIRSNIAYNMYAAKYEKKHEPKEKKDRKYCIPLAASIDFSRYPLLVKLDFAGFFLGVIALCVPYWCIVITEYSTFASFGLWSYCETEVNYCVSVHDNIIPGRDVPVWYFMCQYNFVIGLFMNGVTLAFLTSNIDQQGVHMSPTVHLAAECFSAIAALEKFVAVYTFMTYIEQAEFLYTWNSNLEYHFAFYCGFICLFFDLIVAFMLFLDEEIGPKPNKQSKSDPYLIPLSEQNDFDGVYHHQENLKDASQPVRRGVISSNGHTSNVDKNVKNMPENLDYSERIRLFDSSSFEVSQSADENHSQTDLPNDPYMSRAFFQDYLDNGANEPHLFPTIPEDPEE